MATLSHAASEPAATDLLVVPCKCCRAAAQLFAAIDFHRSCEDRRAPVLPPAGVDIPYHRCGSCGFAFTIAFDDFTPEQFRTYIYNAGYAAVDPDFDDVRPRHNAQMLQQSFGQRADRLRVLDYGGGSGTLARFLGEAGFRDVTTWDPFYADTARPHGHFDLVTAFEVLEHTPTPRATLAELAGFVARDGIVLCSTLLQPAGLTRLEEWWYAAPRNGHVSLHTAASLAALARETGLSLESHGELLHVMRPLVAR